MHDVLMRNVLRSTLALLLGGALFVAGTARAVNYTVTVTKSGAGSGTLSTNYPGIDCASGCAMTFSSVVVLTLTATASDGSVFAGWSGSCTGTAPNCVFVTTANMAVTARFEPASPSSGFNYAPSTAVYKIVNKADGLVLDSGGVPDAGTYVKLWEDVESDNLRWRFSYIGGGYYYIVNIAVLTFLDSGGVFEDGAWLKLWSYADSDNLRWSFVDAGGGYCKIVNKATGKVVDSGGVFDVGSWAKTWSDVESDNLRWQIVRVR